MADKMFGRLGRKSDVDKAAAEVIFNGGKKVVNEKDHVVYNLFDKVCFKAIDKGDGTWLVLYNEEFWPKN